MRIVITGASGQLGAYLVEPLRSKSWEVVPWSGGSRGRWGDAELVPVDLTDDHQVEAALARDDPDAILHAGAVSVADQAFREPERARSVNVEATARLARWCAAKDRRLVFTSTDMVFDGSRSWYAEVDQARPILTYGATKREAEVEALRAPDAVAARLALLYGPSRCGRPTFLDGAVASLRAGERRAYFEDEFRTPLDYRTAARLLVELVDSDYHGLLHLGGRERLSRFEFMRGVAKSLGLDEGLIAANSRADAQFAEPRPADLSMNTSRLDLVLPGVDRPDVEAAIRAMEGDPG